MASFTETARFFIPAYRHHPLRPFSNCNNLFSDLCLNTFGSRLSFSRLTCSAISDTLLPAHDSASMLDICRLHVPQNVLQRLSDRGYVNPTAIQREALPLLFSGRDCVLHSQTGSGKTLAYLLSVFSAVNSQRSAVQALIIVPTRELGIQVVKVARMLSSGPVECEFDKACPVMALLDGGMLKRHKIWLKADPPPIVIATIDSLCQMLEKQTFKLDSLQVLVVDEVDFIFSSTKQVGLLKKLLTIYSSYKTRQTIFASATIPQHKRFLQDCVQQKWTKGDVAYVSCNSVKPMSSSLIHRHVICSKKRKLQTLLSLLHLDPPCSGFIFVGEQSEKSKKCGEKPPVLHLIEFLKSSYSNQTDIVLLEEEMNFNLRASLLQDMRQGKFLVVATDIAARGLDLPDTTHVYNFQLPGTAVGYLHRAGRTGRKPFSDDKCFVTSIISPEERFVLQKYENELMFTSEEAIL